MIRRVSHLAIALLAGAALLAPTALAGGGKPKKHHESSGCANGSTSAVCVYTDGNPSLGGSGQSGPPVPLSSSAANRLKRFGGKDTRVLATIATSPRLGVVPPRTDEAPSVGRVTQPGAFLAALDLGPGPIALFVTLLAGAAAFGLGGALRRRRVGHS